MAANSVQLDAAQLQSLAFPYDKFSKQLDSNPRLVAGSNVYASANKTLRKRGGQGGADITTKTSTGRIDKIMVYQTLENPAKTYIVATFFVSGSNVWNFRYLRLDGTAVWTQPSDLRGVQSSARPHEFAVARGLLYIKGFPTSDLLGTVIFDGRDASMRFWGLLGPTQPARRSGATTTWTAISGNTVRVGWKYVYTWKTNTGHESVRSDLEFLPSNQPSDTGPFSNRKPNIVVRGHPDTTRVPFIVIYRTSDGGGSWRKLAEIANPGDSNVNYLDDDLNGTLAIPDAKLDPRDVAPSLTSNQPPPANLPPAVTGVDAIEPSTNIVYWQGRFWYAMGATLFMSGQEEIRKGIPEECWPSGFFGNFYPFQARICQLMPTADQLWITTTNGTFVMEGRSRDEFSFRTATELVGGIEDQNRAWCSAGNVVFWLSQSFQVAQGIDGQAGIISTPLGNDVRALANTTAYKFELVPYIAEGITWLILFAFHGTDTSLSKAWVYDVNMKLWSPPWSDFKITAACFGQPRETDKIPKLILGLWNSGANSAAAAYYTEDSYSDLTPGAASAGIAFSADTNLWPIPTGNNLNSVRGAAHTANFAGFRLEWQGEAANLAPTVSYALDSTDDADFASVTGVEPTLQANTGGYTTKDYPVESMAQRARLRFSRTADTNPFILETIAALWQTPMGA